MTPGPLPLRPSMPMLASALVAWLLLLPAGAAPLAAQEQREEPGEEPVQLRVDPRDGSLVVRLTGLLNRDLEDALHSGLPIRVHVVAELWKDRFFDGQEGRAEWRATVVYDPLERLYRVRTSAPDGASDSAGRTVGSLEAVRFELQRSFSVPLSPRSEGTFYYMAEVEVETLSLSDLEELQRWLQGELAPAVSGEGNVEGAVGQGVRRLMVRMLGLPARRLRVRTEGFRFDPGAEEGVSPGTPRGGP